MCQGQRSVVEQPDQTTQSLHAPPAADPQSHNSAEEQVVFLPHCVMSFGGSLLVFFMHFLPAVCCLLNVPSEI